MTASDLGLQHSESQEKFQKEIKEKCGEIVKLYGPEHVDYQAQIGDLSFSPKNDLVEACYDTKADILILGSKGVAHSFREKVSEKLNRVGSVADYCLHHAPCDVLVVKQEHDNTLFK